MVIDGDAEGSDLSLLFQELHGFPNFFRPGPFIAPHVKLQKIDALRSKILQALARGIDDIAFWKRFIEWNSRTGGPLTVLWRDLRSGEYLPGTAAQQFSDKLFAVAVAVCQSCIEKIHAEFGSLPQCCHRLFVVGAFPHLAADAPSAKSNFRNVDAGFAQWPKFHEMLQV